MDYFKLGDEVWVVGKIVKVIESESGIEYELKFENGHGAFGDKITLPEDNLVEKKGAEHVSEDVQVN